MSLKKNILANYICQFYVTLVGIFIVPLYIKYMGAESYGLVGFFAMLQAWFNLLDMGLTPTMAREAARFRGGVTDALAYRRLVRALEGIFLVVALVGGGGLLATSHFIARDWLHAAKLPITEVLTAVQLMAAIIALRWMCGLYRGVISGSEQLVWLGTYNSIVATFRFIGVLFVLNFIGTTPTIFFSYQFGIALLELIGLLVQSYRLLPTINSGIRLPWTWLPLKPVLKFSLSIAFTSSIWILVTQTDKLVLSKLLTLEEYGYFTLAVLVAGGVMIISGPISAAIMPRMVRLEAEGNQISLIEIYRKSTQFISIFAGATSITIVFCAEPLLWAWTGNKLLAEQSAPILQLYAIGNGLLAVSAFPYYLQYAKGDLRMHLIGNVLFIFLLIPSIIWSASKYGGVGAGYVWMAMNIIYLVIWVPLVHHRFVPGLNKKWFLQDILLIGSFATSVGFGLTKIMPFFNDRWLQTIEIVFFNLIIMLSGFLVSPIFILKIKGILNKWQTAY